jgi:hypothetical protein
VCVSVRRDYVAEQLSASSAGGFAAAALMNAVSPADWRVSQEVELAVGEVVDGLLARVTPQTPVYVEIVVHAGHVEVIVGAESPDWVTESVRLRPRRPFETQIVCRTETPGPPPPRPPLWAELGFTRGPEFWAEAYTALTEIMQSIRFGVDDLARTLDAIAGGIVSSTCFTVVAVNLAREDGDIEVVAVEGDDDAVHALMGVVEPAQVWHELVSRSTVWGTLRFAEGGAALPSNSVMTKWTPPTVDSVPTGLWNPEDELFAPLYHDGAFIGALSVDLPAGAHRPSIEDMSKLELFAEHAAVAIERARAQS